MRLLGVADGVDSEARNARLDIGIRAAVNTAYLDMVKTETHRGLEGRVVRATRRRLRAMAPMIEMGREFGASFQLDVGVMVGRRFYTEARFDPDALKLLSSLGIELCVSAYPASERPRARTRQRARRSIAT